MTILKRILSAFRRPTVVVRTYKVRKASPEYVQKHEQLAAEIGWPWPTVGRKAVR